MVQKSLYTSSYTSIPTKQVTKSNTLTSSWTTLAKMQEGNLYIKTYTESKFNSDSLLDFYYTDGDDIWYFSSRKTQVWDDYATLTSSSSSSSSTNRLRASKNGEKTEGKLTKTWTVWHINGDGTTDADKIRVSQMTPLEPYVKNTDIEDYNNGNVVNIFFIDNDGATWTFNANNKYVIKRMSAFISGQSKDNIADFGGVTTVIYNGQNIKQVVYNYDIIWQKNATKIAKPGERVLLFDGRPTTTFTKLDLYKTYIFERPGYPPETREATAIDFGYLKLGNGHLLINKSNTGIYIKAYETAFDVKVYGKN